MPVCASCGQENPAGARFCNACGAPLDRAGPREQRKTVTIVFCDLAGSTELGSSTDPERLRALLARYFERMKSIVERHGGTVEKFIGDAVMAVFGVPTVHEDDALRACRAALEMRDALPALALTGRIGVNTGEVVTGTAERLATGDTVNVAARFEQAAGVGEVLIGRETFRHVREAAELGPRRELQLKGKAEPIDAWPLLGLVAGATRRTSARLVGRGEELGVLRAAFETALRERSCQLVTVVGAAGIGKSRLVAEFVRGLDATSAIGRCLSYGEGITYWPVAEVAKQLAPLPSDARAAAALGSVLEGVDVVESADRVAWAFRKLLEERAAERPLVVVLEDLHWAEPTLVDVVEHVALLSRGVPILLLCTARLDLLERPLGRERDVNARTILLEPLDSSATTELLDALGVADPKLRARIAATAEGNPLFVEEVFALAEESGDAAVEIPPTIQALLAARLDQLLPSERTVLECGSVEGRTFHQDAVAALLGEELEVGRVLLGLVRKELVRPAHAEIGGDAFAFRHQLIADAAYAGMPKAARAQLHERLAGWLEPRLSGGHDEDELIGYHLERTAAFRADLGEPDPELSLRAGERLAAAGRRAIWRGDFRGASGLLERAVALIRPLRSDVHLEVTLGYALNRDPAAPATAGIELVRAAAEREQLEGDPLDAEFATLVADLWSVTGSASSAYDLAELDSRTHATVTRLEERGADEALVFVHAAYGSNIGPFTGRWDDWAISAERCIYHARRIGHRWATGFGLAIALACGSRPADEALETFDGILGREAPPLDLMVRAWLVAMLGDTDRAAAEAREAATDVAAYGGYPGGWMLAEIATLAGDHEEAERQLRRQLAFFESRGLPRFVSGYAPLLARTLCTLGRCDEAEALALRGRELGHERDLGTQVAWRQALALVHSSREEHARAVELATEAVTLAAGTQGLNLQGETLSDLAAVLDRAGRLSEAAEHRREALDRFSRKKNLPRSRELAEVPAGAGEAPTPS